MVGQKVILIGFSGGGVLAAELAVVRNDVLALITVAAPLDLDGWTRFHNISPLATVSRDLPSSLGKATFAQRHLYGARDRVVPPKLAASLVRQLPANSVLLVDGLGHDDDWAPTVTAELRLLTGDEGAPGK
jgi:pimeloyl-ACP methyl ester carboxylesterase